jgi:YHS domain-containing protein
VRRRWIMATRSLSAVCVAAMLLAAGCGEKSDAPKAVDTEPAAPASAVETATKAQATCPVMGNAVDRSLYADHEGKRVYFCCAMCIGKFKEDPEKYIRRLEDQGVTVEKAPGEGPHESAGKGGDHMDHGGADE